MSWAPACHSTTVAKWLARRLAREVKKSEALVMQGIMDARHEGQQVATTADVHCCSRTSTFLRKPDPAAHLSARLRLSDPERSTLAEIGKRLGRKALAEVTSVAKPDTNLAWYRRLIASKFDGSKHRIYLERPRIEPEIEALIVQMARENSGSWYDRIMGALANVGHRVSDQTVGNVLRRHGGPAPRRSQNTT